MATINGTIGNDLIDINFLTPPTDLADTINGLEGDDTIFGLGGDDTIDGGLGIDSMTGGLGNDVFIVDNKLDLVIEADEQGTDEIRSSVTYTLSDFVENLVLTGIGKINGTGNDLANTITGNDKNNKIDGGLGDDTMAGGKGNDSYTVDSLIDVVTEVSSQGTDKIESSVNIAALAANVERLTLTGVGNLAGTGNSLNNQVTGNDGNNALDGGAGNDKIKGGAGDDAMTGGLGNDQFYVDDALDTVTELSGSGSGLDSVYSTLAAYTLGANVENLVLKGNSNINGTGNDLANKLTGNIGANTLSGGLGNDTIDGKKGNDTMVGGAGDDKFYVDRIGDVVTEDADVVVGPVTTNFGHDSVIVSFEGYTLSANVEDLFLSGNAITGTGNGLDNLIRGTIANNTLVGGAGNDELDGLLGDDTMTGGLGDDTFVVNTAGDVVNENSGEGTDTVKSSVDYILTDADVENLTLTGFIDIDGTGNSGANFITGNLLGNVLRGLGGNDTLNGGSGDDNMDGGEGSDTYIVGQAGDVVNDTGTGVTDSDTVQSTIAYTLGATIENLVLTGGAALSGTGNTGANAITGNDGSNTLLGLGGADAINGGKGNDLITGGVGGDNLTGGAGSDTFIFTAVADSTTVVGARDAILDFTSIDKVDLSLIDANSSVAGFQHLVLDFNNVLTAGEIMMVRSGSVITVTIDTDSTAGANMQFSITVDSSIPDTLLTEDNFLL